MSEQENRDFDSYSSCLDWLFAKHRFGMKPGLDRINYILEAVGNPGKSFKIVHVAGTNGKGSTSSFVSSILSQHELRTGLYMSPHVLDFAERISVDGKPIRRDRVVDLVGRLRSYADECGATFFEIVTAAAALYFCEEAVDIAVVEVGLGGRLDATNAFDSLLSVITRIAIDHSEVLGSDVATIAIEKAGIIPEGGTVVCGASGSALDTIRGFAAARRARFVPVAEKAVADNVSVTTTGSAFDFRYEGTSYERLVVSMLGRYQIANAATALVSVHELGTLGFVDLAEAELRRGLSEARCVGRLQIIERRPTVVADVAHNPDGAAALIAALAEAVPYDRLIAVVGIMEDKDIRGFFAALADQVDSFILTQASTPRAADPVYLSVIASDLGIPNRVVPSVGAAIDVALSGADEGDLVLITGSHYTVGDALIGLGVGQALEA